MEGNLCQGASPPETLKHERRCKESFVSAFQHTSPRGLTRFVLY